MPTLHLLAVENEMYQSADGMKAAEGREIVLRCRDGGTAEVQEKRVAL